MKKLRLSILLVFIVLSSLSSKAHDFNEYLYVINDYRDKEPELRAMMSDLSQLQMLGIAIKLEFNKESQKIQLASSNNTVLFSDFSESLLNIATQQPNKIIPIFIEYRGPARRFIDELNYSKIYSKVLNIPPGEKWPEYEDILKIGKQFVFFTFQKNRVLNANLMYIWDHMCEFPNSGVETPNFDGFYANGDRKKELLLIRDFGQQLEKKSGNQINAELNENQFYTNHLLNRWKFTGKKPNFIFVKTNPIGFANFATRLNSYISTKGMVTFSGKPLDNVYWAHSEKCITYGFFNFPFSEGEELNLEPFSPGYEFTPKVFTINSESTQPENLIFSATPKSINDGIKAYFPFDDLWDNMVNSADEINIGSSSITNDLERGTVAKLTNNSCIQINSPEYYEIRNNSFTVGAWIKLTELNQQNEYAILGTNEANYRKGLHLVIRNGRPYFGFFGNDLWSGAKIPEMEWFHIVFRYNISNGEQAIFVNGENKGSSLSHASFIGDSLLTVGQCIRRNNYLNGYIDDLCIWNRPLGQEEIKKLYSNEVSPEIIEAQKPNIGLIDIVFAIITLALIVVSIMLFIKSKNGKKDIRLTQTIQDDRKNSIFLFGDLKITNNEGEQVVRQLSPKLKELLIFIMLKTIHNTKGVETSELTKVLWPDFTAQKAANNRSVSFNKLRKVLSQIEGLSLNYNDGYWKAEFNPTFYCDYIEVLSIIEQLGIKESQRPEILFTLVKRGVFLHGYHWPWLDEFRGYISNQVIDMLLSYAKTLNKKDDADLLKAVARRILSVDDLNERALHVELNVLIEKGNMNLARFTFKQFCDNYRTIYNEIYPHNFERFMNKFGEN